MTPIYKFSFLVAVIALFSLRYTAHSFALPARLATTKAAANESRFDRESAISSSGATVSTSGSSDGLEQQFIPSTESSFLSSNGDTRTGWITLTAADSLTPTGAAVGVVVTGRGDRLSPRATSGTPPGDGISTDAFRGTATQMTNLPPSSTSLDTEGRDGGDAGQGVITGGKETGQTDTSIASTGAASLSGSPGDSFPNTTDEEVLKSRSLPGTAVEDEEIASEETTAPGATTAAAAASRNSRNQRTLTSTTTYRETVTAETPIRGLTTLVQSTTIKITVEPSESGFPDNDRSDDREADNEAGNAIEKHARTSNNGGDIDDADEGITSTDFGSSTKTITRNIPRSTSTAVELILEHIESTKYPDGRKQPASLQRDNAGTSVCISSVQSIAIRVYLLKVLVEEFLF